MSKTNQQPVKGAIIIGFLKFLSWLPLRVQQAIGGGLGWVLTKVNNSAKRVSLINLRIAYPDKTEAEIKKIANQSLIETGKTVGELGAIWGWSQAKRLKLIKKVHGEDWLNQANLENGVIFLSPHLGCWELTVHYLVDKFPISALYQPPHIESLDKFVRDSRQTSGAKLVPTDLSGVKAMRRALKNKEALGILPDQDPGTNGGVIAPFFGYPANTMLLVNRLAQKANCPVFYIFAERLPKAQGYEIHLLPADEKIASQDELEAATALNQGVEKCVAIAPAQYQWSYKRFKHTGLDKKVYD